VPFIDYPRVKQSLGIAALRDAYPTTFLNMRGNICGINPLALWLSGALKVGEPFHPERLLGANAFTMTAQQMHRIPAELNREFYMTRSAIVKRQDERSQLTIYAPFIAAMHADPVRAEIYESAPQYPEREWEYPFTIAHPEQPEIMLEFQASIYLADWFYESDPGHSGFAYSDTAMAFHTGQPSERARAEPNQAASQLRRAHLQLRPVRHQGG